MRKIFVVLAFLVAFMPAKGTAQTNFVVSSQNVINSKAELSTTLWATATKKYDAGVGFYAWYLVSNDWGEAVVGPAFFPSDWMEVDLAVGIEKDHNPWRSQGQIWMGNKNGSFLASLEYGGSGFWYVAEGNRALTISGEKIGFGFRAQRFVGIGPRLEIGIGKLKAWASPIMWDTEKSGVTNSMFGITLVPWSGPEVVRLHAVQRRPLLSRAWGAFNYIY